MPENETPPSQPRLVASFLADYERLRREFDKLERTDSYQGHQMELLVGRFLEKWESYMEQVGEFAAEVEALLRHASLSKCSYYESLDDDLRLAQLPCNYRPVGANCVDSNYWNNYKRPELEANACEPRQLLADVYRRACEAAYLRLTYNKARLKLEQDRREPVRLAQRALRYDPHNPKNALWYSVSLGWCLDAVSNPRERVLAGETFKRATQRCLEMIPREGLAHHLLGIYFYHVSSLNWFQRSFAKNFLACKIDGNYADSERELRLSFECRNDWLPTGLWMAKVLLAQGKPLEEARHWVQFGLELEASEPTTELDRDELRELARKLKVGPSD